jgi:hypothetical protein
MNYRKLTEREIRTVIEEQAVYERWRSYSAYAAQVYGSKAALVVVTSDLVYNDEADELQITEIEVYDEARKPLAPDWTSDWWQTTLGDQHAELTARPWEPEDWRDTRNSAIYEAQSKLPVPPHRDEFAVQTPPPRRFPTVYVLKEE